MNLKFSPAATRGYPAAASNSCRSFSQSRACSGKHQRVSVQYYAGWGVQGEKESDEFPSLAYNNVAQFGKSEWLCKDQ